MSHECHRLFILHSSFFILHSTFFILHSTFYILHSTFSIQHSAFIGILLYKTQIAINYPRIFKKLFSIQHSAFFILHSTFYIQHSSFRINEKGRSPTATPLSLVSGFKFQVYSSASRRQRTELPIYLYTGPEIRLRPFPNEKAHGLPLS